MVKFLRSVFNKENEVALAFVDVHTSVVRVAPEAGLAGASIGPRKVLALALHTTDRKSAQAFVHILACVLLVQPKSRWTIATVSTHKIGAHFSRWTKAAALRAFIDVLAIFPILRQLHAIRAFANALVRA